MTNFNPAAIANKPGAAVTDDEARFVASIAVEKHGLVAAEFAGRDNTGRAVIRVRFPADEANLDGEYSVGRVLGLSLRPTPAPAPVKKVSKKAAAAVRRENRYIVPVADLPRTGVVTQMHGKPVVFESFGKSWILDTETADAVFGILHLDGERVCYGHYREPTAAELAR